MAETSRRGFASMDPAKQREIASKGGRAAHAKGTAHEFTSDEARVAGRKGGEVVSRNREHMSEIGRRGGERRGANRSSSTSSLSTSANRPQSGTDVVGSYGQQRGSDFESSSRSEQRIGSDRIGDLSGLSDRDRNQR